MKILKRIVFPLVIVVIAVGFVNFLIKTKPAAKQKAAAEQVWIVDAESIQTGEYSPIVTLYGQIISNAEIDVSANIEASVKTRHVNIGERVSKDQILLTLDSYVQEQILAQREAEVNEIRAQIEDDKLKFANDKLMLEKEQGLLEIANSAVKRAMTLEKSEMASSSQLDDARKLALSQELAVKQRQLNISSHPSKIQQLEARLKQASSRLALAKKDLADTVIRSPANGIIRAVSIDAGEYTRKNNTLLKIIDTDAIELRALIPEKYLSTILQSSSTDPLNARLIINDEIHDMTLSRISNFIEKSQAGSYAYFTPGTSINLLTTGQTFEIQLILPPIANSVLLPHEALYGTSKIFRIKENLLQPVNIEWLGEGLDAEGNKKILLTSPELNTGDLILINKFANAIKGLKVKLKTEAS